MKKKTLRNILAAVGCLIIAVAIGAVVYKSIPVENVPVTEKTPNTNYPRVGKRQVETTPYLPFTFAGLCEEVTDVAVVRILDWLGEDSSANLGFTCFEAEVIDLVYGETLEQNERFTLRQTGSSECTIDGYSLYGIGEEVMLFLKSYQTDDEIKIAKTEYVYIHIGSYYTEFDLIELNQERFLKRRVWSHYSDEIADTLISEDDAQRSGKELAKSDSTLSKDFLNSSKNIYSYDKLAGLIKQNAEGK